MHCKEFLTEWFRILPKPRGRPRSFDETGALEKATQVFLVEGL